jgi:AcrR family transcriptional regulator
MKKPDAPATLPATPKPRGRPRSFDREAALDAAMQVFWDKGYEGASISDLTAAMGVSPPSLYAAFGDKETLFLEAADRYMERADACPFETEPTARGAVEALLRFLATDITDSSHPRGCLMMLASATAVNASPKLQKALALKRAEAREHLMERIKRGIQEGDVPAGTDVGELADFYATIVSGLSQQAREGATRKSLIATVERAMSLFPSAPPPRRKPRLAETA